MSQIASSGPQNRQVRGKDSFFSKLWSQKQLMLMSIPITLYVFLFNYAPMWGWITAFMKYNPKNKNLFDNPWVGLDNFKWLFNRPEWLGVLRNTLAMSLINLVFGTLSAVILAVLLNEVFSKRFKRTVQTVTYLPHFLSLVIVVSMAQNIFATDGAVNQLLLKLHIIKEPVFWLGEGVYFWWLVGVINVWKEVGWNSIIYISTMTSIDPSLYEAAAIDGAGRFQKILHVTLPGIKSTFVVLLIMNIGHLLEAGFEIQYLMGQNLVIDWSQTIDVFVMKYGISKQQYSVAVAAGMFKSIVSILLLFVANFIAKRLDEDTLI